MAVFIWETFRTSPTDR